MIISPKGLSIPVLFPKGGADSAARASGSFRTRLVFAPLTLALLGLTALNSAPQAAHAQTYNYSPTGLFSTGFGLPLNADGSPTDEFVFAVTSLHTATYNFSNPYYLNKLTFNHTGNLTLARGGSAANQFVFNGTTPTIALNNTGTLTVAIDMALNALTTVSGSGSATFSGVISGANGLAKTGTGTLTLGNIGNSFTGNLVINQGTLIAGAAQTTTNPATSVLGSTMTSGRTITVGDGTNAATLNFAASNVFGTGNSNPQGSITINKNGRLTNSGGQFNILPNIILNGGSLSASSGLSATRQSFAFAYGSVTVGGDARSNIFGSGTNAGYHLGGSTTFNVGITGDALADILVFGDLVDNFDNNGAGGLVKTGAGTMVLGSRYNTYTGSTTVNGGTLLVGIRASNGSSLGSGTGSVTVNNGGTLYFVEVSQAGSAITTVNSGGTLGFYDQSSADRATINNNGGTVVFGNGANAGTAVINNNGGTLTVAANSSASAATINNNTGGSLSITSSAGNATITNNSTADFYGAATAGSATITNNNLLTFHDTSTAAGAIIQNNGTFFVNQRSGGLSVGDLSGTGNVLLGSNSLTVGGLNKSGAISGVISGSSGTGNLIKTGTGTLTLTGSNTYSGGTTISGGTLAARGSGLGTGAATVNAGGTLAVGQAANFARTALSGGPQSLSLTSLVVSSAANNTNPFLTFNLFGGGMSDTLSLTGTGTALSFSSASGTGSQFIVGFASGTGALLSGQTYTLMTFSNPSASVISGFDMSNANNSFMARGTGNLGGTNGTFSWTKNSGGSITGLQYSLISSSDTPEPSSLPLVVVGLAGGACILLRRRERSSRKVSSIK